MVGLLGFILNPWSKPTRFKLFRSMAHSLFYNCSSNMCQSPNYRQFLPNNTFENDSHSCDVIFQVVFFILKSTCMFPTSIPYLCAQI